MNIKKFSLLLSCTLAAFVISPIAQAVTNNIKMTKPAPDSTSKGPYQIASAEYHFPAMIHLDILPGRMTELWAKIFYPKNITNTAGKVPLIIILHGNHATCGTGLKPRHDTSCAYTTEGTCPSGFVVTPNHEGYNYLAENLASWGFWVVSINANRGITCGGGMPGDSGLNLARGRLVLKHLSLLYAWATEGGAPASLGLGENSLIDKIDFSSVGFFGHSRGGEGVRAAYNLYSDPGSKWPAKIPGLKVKAIFEVGAVDGQTSRVLDANGTVWNQLLPMCDGDVSNLEGRYPFERMLLNDSEDAAAQKSLYEVWGANHNYFNTEWQESDAGYCAYGKPIFDSSLSGSELQQKVALASVPAFFRSRLGSNPNFNQNFNPLDTLPEIVTTITQIDRDFTASPAFSETNIIENFDKKTGINTSGNPNLAGNITVKHHNLHDKQRVSDISWKEAGPETFFEAVIEKAGEGRDLRDYATLDLRIARTSDTENATDFSVQLEDASGHFSNSISISDYALINGPGNYNIILKTVRIPLAVFKGIDLAQVHGVRFVFDKSETGSLYLANIRAHKQLGLGEEQMTLMKSSFVNNITSAHPLSYQIKPDIIPASKNTIRSIRVMPAGQSLEKPEVEIVVASQVPFPAMNTLPVLQIGENKFNLSRYSDVIELKELTFTIPFAEYKKLSAASNVTVSDGKIWQFRNLSQYIQ